jgi:hypothetical protein
MKRKLMSRREALGVVGKTGIALGAAPDFFVSLNTARLATDGQDPVPPGSVRGQTAPPKPVIRGREKVVISGSGSTLTVKVQGPPGRHFAVACATADEPGRYAAVVNARGLIGEDGSAVLDVRVADLPNGRIFVRVLTAAAAEFTTDRKGTKAFELHIADGVVTRFAGVRERPLEGNAGAASTVAASALAVPRR